MLLNEYLLGIIWALGSWIEPEKRMVFRSNSRYFLEKLQCIFNYSIYEQEHHLTKEAQYVLKVSNIDIHYLYSIGWTNRNAKSRDIPIEINNQKDFLRGYIEVHSSLKHHDVRKTKQGKYRSLRLRIYGNAKLMESINYMLSQNASVKIKTLEISSINNQTATLNYQSVREITKIYDYLEGKPCNPNYWDDVYNKLANPRVVF